MPAWRWRGNLWRIANAPGKFMRTVSRIVAATDFSAASDAALARAGQLAAREGAQLRIIHATPDWNLFSNRAPMRITAPWMY